MVPELLRMEKPSEWCKRWSDGVTVSAFSIRSAAYFCSFTSLVWLATVAWYQIMQQKYWYCIRYRKVNLLRLLMFKKDLDFKWAMSYDQIWIKAFSHHSLGYLHVLLDHLPFPVKNLEIMKCIIDCSVIFSILKNIQYKNYILKG